MLEAGWAAAALRPHHRAVSAEAQRGRGREVLSLDGTDAHHERGPQMGGVTKAWDHGDHRLASSPTVMTGVLAKRVRLEGLAGLVQPPTRQEEELAEWPETMGES